jgi:hypothetical protein
MKKNTKKSDSLQSLPNEMVEIHPMRVRETSGDLARKLKTLGQFYHWNDGEH